MKNDYEVRGDVTAIFLTSKKYGNMEALISTNKLDRAKELKSRWRPVFAKSIETYYIVAYLRENGKQIDVKLHRWLTEAPQGMQVDHINHDTLNNTDMNLRVITKDENNQNRSGAQRNSKSGILGVMWVENRKEWVAKFGTNNKQIQVGYFKNVEDAEFAIKEARKTYMPYSQEALAK